MIYPILTYGNKILRDSSEEIDENYPGLHEIISNMWETMYGANGVGLAAPQIGKSIKLFIIDATTFEDEYPTAKGFKKIFINPTIIEESGEKKYFNESCLSFPEINENILRYSEIIIEYYDENFNLFREKYDGIIARIIQHEYDHLQGELLIDHINPIRRSQISKSLKKILTKKVKITYKIK